MNKLAADHNSPSITVRLARIISKICFALIMLIGTIDVFAADIETDHAPVLHIVTSIGEEGAIPLPSDNPRDATISVWNIYEAGILTRSRIIEIRRTEVTERIRSLHLWNLAEPQDWSFLDSFPNLERLTITGMMFEEFLLFDHGSRGLKTLIVQDCIWAGDLPTISLKGFPSLEEFGITFFYQWELPLMIHVPSTLETISFRFPDRIEIRPIPEELEVLSNVSTINISPLYALPPVYRRFPQLKNSAGPWEGDYLPKPQ